MELASGVRILIGHETGMLLNGGEVLDKQTPPMGQFGLQTPGSVFQLDPLRRCQGFRLEKAKELAALLHPFAHCALFPGHGAQQLPIDYFDCLPDMFWIRHNGAT